MSKNAEKLVKFGPVVAEIFGKICKFLSFSKSTETPGVISGVSGPIFTQNGIKCNKNIAVTLPAEERHCPLTNYQVMLIGDNGT